MMKLDRRSMLLAGTAVVAAVGGFAYFRGSPETSTPTGITAANAASADVSELHEPPAIGEMFLGEADAPVTVIEYASATCPHCANFHTGAFEQIKNEFIETGKVKFVFREFPFDDLALAAFMLARCAPEGKYFPMIDILFERQQQWTSNDPRAELFKIAQLAGFTRTQFDECLKNEEVARGILEIREKGAKQFGVESTPTFFINGEMLRGNQTIEAFREAIEAASS